MATLESACELAWRQCFPTPSDETGVTKEEFIESGQLEMATQLWLAMWNERSQDGNYDIPSYLLSELEVEVINNEVDLSEYNILRGLPKNIWLRQVGQIGCGCDYIQTTQNLSALLCDEESRGHGYRTYLPLGKKIKFPQGTHSKKLTLVVANMGENIDGTIEVDDVIGSIVRDKLVEKYLGRTNPVDNTNNSNSNA